MSVEENVIKHSTLCVFNVICIITAPGDVSRDLKMSVGTWSQNWTKFRTHGKTLYFGKVVAKLDNVSRDLEMLVASLGDVSRF